MSTASASGAVADRGARPFVELRGLAKRFGDQPVLFDLDLEVREGEILALVGPSGSGKTTILRLLAGFEQPNAGDIRLAGSSVVGLPPAKRAVGMVFQHYALFPHMTVQQNVAFGLEAQGWSAERATPRIAEVLRLVDLDGFGERRVGEISGGQQQRVALARALAPEPELLLLDEPLSNLDPTLRERTRRELREAVRQVGITTVLVTHEQEEAFHLGDRVAVLHSGRLRQVGAPRELYQTPRSSFVATFVGRASVLPGRAEDSAVAGSRVAVRLDVTGTEAPVVWQAEAGEALAAGQEVELVVRPEGLECPAAQPGHSLRGEVAEVRYTGPQTYAIVQLAAGQEVEARVDPAAELPTAGSTVSLAPRPGALLPRVFPRTQDGA